MQMWPSGVETRRCNLRTPCGQLRAICLSQKQTIRSPCQDRTERHLAATTAKFSLKTRNHEEKDGRAWQTAELETVAGCFNKIHGKQWSSRYHDALNEATEELKRYRDSVVAPQKRPKPRTSNDLYGVLQHMYIHRMFPPQLALTGEELFQRLQEANSRKWDESRKREDKA